MASHERWGRDKLFRRKITLKGEPLQKVYQFCYLDTTIESNGDYTTDITIRTSTALSVMSSLSSIFMNRKIAWKNKIHLYKSLIQLIALYGCKTWTPRRTAERKLLVYDTTTLRLLLGVTKLDRLRNGSIREQLSLKKTILQVLQHRLSHVLMSPKLGKRLRNGSLETPKWTEIYILLPDNTKKTDVFLFE